MKELDKPDVRQYYYVKDHQDVLVDAGIVRTDRCVAVPDTYTFYHTSDKNAYNQEMTNILGYAPMAFNEIPTGIWSEETGELVMFTWGQGMEEVFYIYVAESVAEPLTKALYQLVHPGQDGDYATLLFSSSEEQPMCALEFSKYDTIPISLGADPTPLADALAITVTDGALTQEEVDNIVVAVSAYAGQEVNVMDFIPPSWRDMVITEKEAMKYYPIPRV